MFVKVAGSVELRSGPHPGSAFSWFPGGFSVTLPTPGVCSSLPSGAPLSTCPQGCAPVSPPGWSSGGDFSFTDQSVSR